MRLELSKGAESKVRENHQAEGCKRNHVRQSTSISLREVHRDHYSCNSMPPDYNAIREKRHLPKDRRRHGKGSFISDKMEELGSQKKLKRKYISQTRLSFCLSRSLIIYILFIVSSSTLLNSRSSSIRFLPFVSHVDASLIIGDSAIEIQEVDDGASQPRSPATEQTNLVQPSVILDSTGDNSPPVLQNQLNQNKDSHVDDEKLHESAPSTQMRGPLPPIVAQKSSDDVFDGDGRSRGSHDYDLANTNSSPNPEPSNTESLEAGGKPIAGKVVDFELTPAGGHNKAKIKKKKKKKKEESMHKKWAKKKKSEKKALEKKHKEGMKKKKEEGKKGKKKWGKEEHGQKKKGNFKKKKWGKKVKKGKGVKKGKKGKKFLKDKGHKNTGFKTVYHKEEWGKSSKWHDIKREKKWDEKAKKWKKKWKKEKGKKYKGDHMKKFEKKKKSGKKYKKEKKDKYKKFKKEEFKKGMKKKKEEHGKKKEGGVKKEIKEMKKKKKKKG